MPRKWKTTKRLNSEGRARWPQEALYFDATASGIWLPRIHSRIVRYCQLDSFRPALATVVRGQVIADVARAVCRACRFDQNQAVPGSLMSTTRMAYL